MLKLTSFISRPINDEEQAIRAELKAAERNYRRALTVFNKEQDKGKSDISVVQTRKMAKASFALNRAGWKLEQANRSLRLFLNLTQSRAITKYFS